MSADIESAESPHFWSQPLAGSTGYGQDLEYDNRYLELVQLAQGKPETQFDEAVAPDWPGVLEMAESLLDQSRDLRLVFLWAQANLNLKGLFSLNSSLAIIADFFEYAWEGFFPELDPQDMDPYARLNVLEDMGRGSKFFESVRQAQVFQMPGVGLVNLRYLEALLDPESYPGLDVPFTREQLEVYWAENPDLTEALRAELNNLHARIERLQLAVRMRCEHQSVSALSDLSQLALRLNGVMPPPHESNKTSPDSVLPDTQDTPIANMPKDSLSAPLGAVSSRAQALLAIEQVCKYLEKAEPTNPAQLLLKRASRLINKNFLEVVRDLAPDALSEVARVMGVDPSALEADSD